MANSKRITKKHGKIEKEIKSKTVIEILKKFSIAAAYFFVWQVTMTASDVQSPVNTLCSTN